MSEAGVDPSPAGFDPPEVVAAVEPEPGRSLLPQVERGRWRVLTWNLLGAKHPDLATVAAVIVEQQPDVVAVQEVRRRQAVRLARRLGWSVRWTRKHFPLTPLVWWRAEGLAVMSAHRLSYARRLTLTPGTSTSTHRHRVVLAATVERGTDVMRIYNAHLASGDPIARINQAALTARLVAAEQDAPRSDGPSIAAATTEGATLDVVHVVAGDLNEPHLGPILEAFAPVGLIDPGGAPTNPAEAPHQRLDYVLVPGTVTVDSIWVPSGGPRWERLSDHLPVCVTFRLTRQPVTSTAEGEPER